MFGENSYEKINVTCNQDESKQAILFMNLGNATLDQSIHVSLMDCKDNINPDQPGNIFVADSDHNITKIDSACVNIKWLSLDTLRITYDSKLRVFNNQTKFENVVIVYEKSLVHN
jgi:hypothetical protein